MFSLSDKYGGFGIPVACVSAPLLYTASGNSTKCIVEAILHSRLVLMKLWYSLLDLTISRYVTLNTSAVIAVNSEMDEVHHIIHIVYTDFFCIIVFQ